MVKFLSFFALVCSVHFSSISGDGGVEEEDEEGIFRFFYVPVKYIIPATNFSPAFQVREDFALPQRDEAAIQFQSHNFSTTTQKKSDNLEEEAYELLIND